MIGVLSRTGRLAIAAIFCAVGGAPGMEERAEAADLEERVADLEATTARKGNKKVTVQIYGKVNQATMSGTMAPFGRPHLLLTDLLSSGVKTALRGGLFLCACAPLASRELDKDMWPRCHRLPSSSGNFPVLAGP